MALQNNANNQLNMFRKRQLDDVGAGVETLLLGRAVFLDVWAVRDFSRENSSELREQFARPFNARGSSLLA